MTTKHIIIFVYVEHLEKTSKEERLVLSQITQSKIEQKTRAATERVAMGLDNFTRKMLNENRYMNQEVFYRSISLINEFDLVSK